MNQNVLVDHTSGHSPSHAAPMRAMAWGRIGVGGLAILAPAHALRVFALPAPGVPPLVVRAFGAREIALGVAMLALSDSASRRRMQVLCVAVDACDGIATVVGARRGEHSRWTTAIAGGAAFSHVALGLRASGRR